MEQNAASVVPCDIQVPHWSMGAVGDFQLSNWTTVEPAAAWAPGLAVEYASCTGIYGGCLEASLVPSYNGGQLLAQYHAAAAAAATQNHRTPIEHAPREFFVDFNRSVETRIHHLFEDTAAEFKAGIKVMREKIHRYPASIRALGNSWYTVPRMVAIGPYHHGQPHLRPAEKVNHLAAYHCMRESGRTVQEMYDAVVRVAGEARSLYDQDVMQGIDDRDFLPIMFFDACFLVQFMFRLKSRTHLKDPSDRDFIDPSLDRLFTINDHGHEVLHDLMMLENQIPWLVVEAIMMFRPVPWRSVMARFRGILCDRKEPASSSAVMDVDPSYKPPHLLGLLRSTVVGRSDGELHHQEHKIKSISYSVSATELAEIGIRLTPSKTTQLIHMGMKEKGMLFAELSLPSLTMDDIRTSCLVNMAALEMCSTKSFSHAKDEDSAVCSYLLLFSMILDREEDVHELRRNGLLQGGAGLTDSEVLSFFTSIKSLHLGKQYVQIMKQIEHYRVSRKKRTKAHAFVYKNKKTIITVFTIIVGVISIIGTLTSLKGRR